MREGNMNVAMWALVGGAAGWIGFSLLNFNVKRGMPASIVIGMVAALVGGELVAPMVSAALTHPGDFNPLSLFTAFASAAGCLVVGDMIYNRFGV
jgi:uncharacterized membrane protein YeaQ/YmgE (transglycosylase-associated protein family)